MDLDIVRLVTFIIHAESYAGFTAKSPAEIRGILTAVNDATEVEHLRIQLMPDLVYQLDNYLAVWDVAEEAPAPPSETELQAIYEEEVGREEAPAPTPELELQELTPADVGEFGKAVVPGEGDRVEITEKGDKALQDAPAVQDKPTKKRRGK